MPKKQLERLLFVQGGKCFFCKALLAKADASVEHLQASARGGNNSDDNCVACCKSLNHVLGSMPLKDKIKVFLEQEGVFRCPRSDEPTQLPPTKAGAKPAATPKAPTKKPAVPKTRDVFAKIVKSLKRQGDSGPSNEKALMSTVSNLLKQHKSTDSAEDVIAKLFETGACTKVGKKVVVVR